jgi:hypothetical protein
MEQINTWSHAVTMTDAEFDADIAAYEAYLDALPQPSTAERADYAAYCTGRNEKDAQLTEWLNNGDSTTLYTNDLTDALEAEEVYEDAGNEAEIEAQIRTVSRLIESGTEPYAALETVLRADIVELNHIACQAEAHRTHMQQMCYYQSVGADHLARKLAQHTGINSSIAHSQTR